MLRRFQFSLKWLFVAMLAVACFFGGIHFERERRRREDAWDDVPGPSMTVVYGTNHSWNIETTATPDDDPPAPKD